MSGPGQKLPRASIVLVTARSGLEDGGHAWLLVDGRQMKSGAAPSASSSTTVAAPTGSPRPSIMSSRVRPNMSMVIWQGMSSTPSAWAASSSSLRAGDAVLLGEAAHHPRAHAQEVHLRELPMADARTLHDREHLLHPVLAGDPLVLDERLETPEGQETFVGTPLAAAVVARISDAQVFSRSPL